MNRLPPFDGLDDLLYPFRHAEKLARELGDLDYAASLGPSAIGAQTSLRDIGSIRSWHTRATLPQWEAFRDPANACQRATAP